MGFACIESPFCRYYYSWIETSVDPIHEFTNSSFSSASPAPPVSSGGQDDPPARNSLNIADNVELGAVSLAGMCGGWWPREIADEILPSVAKYF